MDADNCVKSDTSNCSTILRAGTLTISCCGYGRIAAADNLLCGRCLPGYSEWGGQCVGRFFLHCIYNHGIEPLAA